MVILLLVTPAFQSTSKKVQTALYDYKIFYGTSAAAPAIAAIVAVMKQRYGRFLTPSALKFALQSGRKSIKAVSPAISHRNLIKHLVVGDRLDSQLLLDMHLFLRPHLSSTAFNMQEGPPLILCPRPTILHPAGVYWTRSCWGRSFRECIWNLPPLLACMYTASSQARAAVRAPWPCPGCGSLYITASDSCDPNPVVTMNVWSDELNIKSPEKWKYQQAQLC